MELKDLNKEALIRATKEIVRKAKLASSLRGNGESIGMLVGALLDKELKRLGVKGNNDDA